MVRLSSLLGRDPVGVPPSSVPIDLTKYDDSGIQLRNIRSREVVGDHLETLPESFHLAKAHSDISQF